MRGKAGIDAIGRLYKRGKAVHGFLEGVSCESVTVDVVRK